MQSYGTHLLVAQVSEWPAVRELSVELEPFASLYIVTNEFAMRREDWLFGSIKHLDAEQVENCVGEWFKKVSHGSPQIRKQRGMLVSLPCC